MELTAAHFIQWLQVPPADSEPHLSDRRDQPRAQVTAAATIIPLEYHQSPGAVRVEIRDVSPSGIGIIHDRCFSLDEQFALLLPQAADTPAVVLCVVAFWQPVSRNAFAIGGRFVRVLRDVQGGLPLQIQTPPMADLRLASPLRRSA
jgi:hypothetical protein